jgi:hypothetical protein
VKDILKKIFTAMDGVAEGIGWFVLTATVYSSSTGTLEMNSSPTSAVILAVAVILCVMSKFEEARR